MDENFSRALSALAGQEVTEAAEVAHEVGNGDWFSAKFSHRHPTRKLLVFGLSDDMYGLFAWARDTGYPVIVKGREADVQIRPYEIRTNGSTYHFQATAVKFQP